MKSSIRVLFVCLGNICRSPMAEYLMRDKVQKAGLQNRIEVDSAGTSGWNDGQDMHCGTAEILELHRINTKGFCSRKVRISDWQEFDYIIAMDNENLADLEQLFSPQKNKLFQITSLCPDLGIDHIPDPWYTRNFHQTYELLDRCLDILLQKLRAEL